MPRSPAILGAASAAVAILLVAGTVLVWPRLAAEHERAVAAVRARAAGVVPVDVVDDAWIETRPTLYGWRVVFRDVQVPCSHTKFRCTPPDGVPSELGPDQVFRAPR